MDIKKRSDETRMAIHSRQDILRKGLAAKRATQDTRRQFQRTATFIADQPDEQMEPEGYAADTGMNVFRNEMSDVANRFNRQGKRSTAETYRNIREARRKQGESRFRNSIDEKQGLESSYFEQKQGSPASRNGIKRDIQNTKDSIKPDTSIARNNIKQDTVITKNSIKWDGQSSKNSIKSDSQISVTGVKQGNRTVRNGTKRDIRSLEAGTKQDILTLPRKATLQNQMKEYSKTRLVNQKMTSTLKPGGILFRVSTAPNRAKVVAVRLKNSLKAIIQSTKALLNGAFAAGWLAVMLVVMVSMVGALANTPLGLFFSGGTSKVSMTSIIREINRDFETEIENLKAAYVYDELVMNGRKSIWKDVLTVYAVRTSMDNPSDTEQSQTVSMITEENKEILKEIFWTMNTISASTEVVTYAVDPESQGPGSDQMNAEPEYKEKTVLTIDILHLTAEQMAEIYEFTEEQKTAMEELGKDEYDELWTMLLYGTSGGYDDILQVAMSQLGNEGGEPYWSWWGYTSRVDWCAIFVSWCANECGYLEKDLFPKFQGVGTGLNWFKERGQFRDNMYEPMPGDIIFFDWADDGFDGLGDHVGIVERVGNGLVWTVEGNRTDSVSQGVYSLGSLVIIGYGVIID